MCLPYTTPEFLGYKSLPKKYTKEDLDQTAIKMVEELEELKKPFSEDQWDCYK